MGVGHPAYYDNTPENIYPFGNQEEYHQLIVLEPQIKSIPLKAPYMEAPRGTFAVAAFNPLVQGHHYTSYYGPIYDEHDVEDTASKEYYTYLAIREDVWPVSNKQIVIVPSQPVTPDIYRQTMAKYTSPSLAGSAPTEGVYTGIGSTNQSGYNTYGFEPV